MPRLPFGDGWIDVPETLASSPILAATDPPALPDPLRTVAGALARPLGSAALSRFVEPGDRVAVVVPDATRRSALLEVLPAVLAAVRAAGPAEICLRIASGTGARATAGERASIEAAAGLAPGDREADDAQAHQALGRTAHGVARIDAQVARADRIVLLGPISFHYLAGFGGGGKLLAPGCADRETALFLHRTCLTAEGRHPMAVMGAWPRTNPLHAAIDEVLALAPPCFLVQVALTRQGRLAAVFAGEVRAAHAQAAAFHHRHHAVRTQLADTVVVSAGGAPFDVNLLQAHEALEAAAHAVRPGGAVILLAACPEGAGSPAFASSLTALALRQKTAALRCAAVAPGVPDDLLAGLGLRPCRDLGQALAAVGGDPGRTLLIPDGARTLPLTMGALLGGGLSVAGGSN